MIEVRFDTEALTRVRFAISPMLELTRSITALDDPAGRALHLPWAERARPQIEDLDLSPLRALQTSGSYNPDFVNPPPSGPLAEFEDELAVMLATPPSQIRAEIRAAYGDAVPPVLEPFLERPRHAMGKLAELMRAYWEGSLAEYWPRIHSLLEQDVLYRARQIADGGTQRLFADLDDSVRWSDGVLRLSMEGCDESEGLDLDERGLLLAPSVFVWPKVTIVTAQPWQPTLIYPARGVGMLWGPDHPVPPDALARLIGNGRAAVLMELDCPRSTTELAGALGISTGGVSQHLAVLHDAGLVSRRRVARFVLYLRSPEGDALVSSAAS
jgi:hypothetical protein